ncbi:RGS domain-containing protein [Syncephalis fuscata]|nr:RGS domain-containing protein [Syncephalis fuscata]
MPISALLYTAFLVSSWAFPDTTSKVHPPSPFPPAAYAAIHFVCGHCIFVVWPAFCVFFARRGRRASADSQTIKQEQDHRAFEQMLSDSSRFKKFKAFCVTDFSVENALFLERYRRFKHLAEMGNQTGSASNSANSASKIIEKGMAFFTGGTTSRPQSRAAEYSDSATDLSTYAEQPLSNEATKEFKIIYATFIAPESEFEINLTSSCRQNIITNIHNGNINTGILDEAEREIYQLVYHSTYPRYIAYKKRRISVASNVGVGTRINQHIGL